MIKFLVFAQWTISSGYVGGDISKEHQQTWLIRDTLEEATRTKKLITDNHPYADVIIFEAKVAG